MPFQFAEAISFAVKLLGALPAGGFRPCHLMTETKPKSFGRKGRKNVRILRKATITSAAVLLIAIAAYAQNVHLKPPNRPPTFVDQVLALEAVGNLAGLGEGDVVITLSAMANATATCTNPGGGTQPPGQNPAPISVQGTQAIPDGEIKNGNVSFDVKTMSPATPIPGAPGCPNPNWTENITDLSFTSATITVQQADTTVLTVACTFNPATSNGPVPGNTVRCTVT